MVSLEIVRRIKFDVPNYAHRLAWSHDGQRLALGSVSDKRLSVWDVKTGNQFSAPGDQIGGTYALAYSPDGRYLAVARAPVAAQAGGQERYTVSLWDARTAGLVRNLVEPDPAEIPRIETRHVAFSADGRFVAVVYPGKVALYVLDAGGSAQRVSTTNMKAQRCAFRPDGGTLACLEGGFDARTVLLQVPDGHIRDTIEGGGNALAWSPDGVVLTRSNVERVTIFDVPSRRMVQTVSLQEKAAFVRLSFSVDGRWLAAMDYQRLDLWDTRTWAHVSTLVAKIEHAQLFQDATFSPRGPFLAVAGGNLATIWEVRDR